MLSGCSSSTETDGDTGVHRDTISFHPSGAPKQVEVRREDSVLSQQTYRHTGVLRRIERGDTIQRYFDLHDPDSSAIFKDYLQGRWRNLSADTTSDQASAYYIFDGEQLVFQNASSVPLESLSVTYNDRQRLKTETGMNVRPTIIAFDTVEVTGYTLVRYPPEDTVSE